jgi:hypothetical protein
MVAAKARKLKLKKYPMLEEGRVYFLMKFLMKQKNDLKISQ